MSKKPFKKLTKKLSNTNGLVILEYAIVALVGLPLLVLLLDVGNILRVKTVLQESVKRTLRCLTPLDGDCVALQNIPPERLYQVRVQKTSELWPLPQYSYYLRSESLLGPTDYFSNPVATVLDQVSYQAYDRQYAIKRKRERLKVKLDYNLQTATLPYVDTGTSSATTLTPKFTYLRDRQVNYPREINNLTQVSGTVKSLNHNGSPFYKLIGTINFTAPQVDPISCYKSHNINRSSLPHNINYESECDLSRLPVILYITGSFPKDSLAENSRGKVWLNLKGKGLKINGQSNNFPQFNLGGRAFTYNSSNMIEGNFVPRGVPLSNLASANNYHEFDLYQDISLVPGETYTLEFYLQRANQVGEYTGWKGDKLRIFYGQIIRMTEEYDCEDSQIVIENGRKVCSQLKVNDRIIPNNLITSTNTYLEEIIETTSCLKATAIPPACSDCQLIALNNNNCAGKTEVIQDCPTNNGVFGNPNNEAFIEAQKLCPVSDPFQSLKDRPAYTEMEIQLPNKILTFQSKDCHDSFTSFLSSTDNRQYPKLKWTKHEKFIDRIIDTHGIIPSDFKSKFPEYDCLDFPVKFKNYDFRNYIMEDLPEGIRDSFLYGDHSLESTGCDWEEAVKNQTSSLLKINNFDYLKVHQTLSNYLLVEEKPTFACYNNLPIKDLDNQIATDFEELGPVTLEEVPSVCQDPEYHCDIKLVGFKGKLEKDFSWDQPLAIQQGYAALNAAYPSAKLDCDPQDINCFDMKINFDGKLFDVYAGIEIPLFSLLGKKQIKLNYRNQGLYQGSIIEAF